MVKLKNNFVSETIGVAAAPSTQVDQRQLSRAAVVCGTTFTSPSKNHIPYIRTSSWPKQSPVATVYPQVHIKDEECQKISKYKSIHNMRNNDAVINNIINININIL